MKAGISSTASEPKVLSSTDDHVRCRSSSSSTTTQGDKFRQGPGYLDLPMEGCGIDVEVSGWARHHVKSLPKGRRPGSEVQGWIK